MFPTQSSRAARTRLPLLALALLILAGIAGPTTTRAAAAQGDGVVALVGDVTFSHPYRTKAAGDTYVALRDANGYFGATEEAATPGRQTLGDVEGDITEGAEYALSLPIVPRGTPFDLGTDGDDGVQVYFVQLVTNWLGDPFLGPDELNWGLGVSSVQISYEDQSWSGSLVAWAPDGEARFPSGPGRDGRLFTADDPAAPLAAGWTVVALEDDGFDFVRAGTAKVPLLEAEGMHIDLSDRGYVDAFDALLADLRTRYAFGEVKEVDFDAIEDEIRPLVVEAERDDDAEAFHVAMLRFAPLFGDGHVSIDVRAEPLAGYLEERWGGGLGLTLGETDGGELVAAAVAPGSPAAEAGIEAGAEIVRWAGEEPADALDGVAPMRGASSPHGARRHALSLLPRMPAGAQIELRVRNPGADAAETVELEAEADPAGLDQVLRRHDPNPAQLPISAAVLPSGAGYIRIDTFMDDFGLMFDSWAWTLAKMEELGVPSLVLDVRGNGGGWMDMATYFAGSFTDETFLLARDYVPDEDGEFRQVGAVRIFPSPTRWDPDRPVAVLVDEGCASSCELFAAALAHDPAHEIVGHTPSAGVEAAIAPWTLPDGLYFQASVVLMLDDDGEVYLEGTGVPPTVDVPVTADSLVSPEDEVLLAAEAALAERVEDAA